MGYTEEELNVLLKPMAASGAEPIGSMGNDAPLAAISARPRQLFDYFNQLFAQVTNPPLDAIREELVTSLGSQLGPEQNLLEAGAAHCRTIMLPEPVLTNDDLARIVHINDDGDYPGFTSRHRARHVPRRRGRCRGCSKRLARSARRCRRPSRTARG